MATKFLVWANKACNGKNIQWKQISGFEFFRLIKQPANKNRFFIKLPAEEWYEDEIFIESTQEQYVRWKKEENHKAYISKENQKFQTISQYNYTLDDEDGIDILENIPDKQSNFEEIIEQTIMSNELHKALEMLTENEILLINYRYSNKLTIRETAKKMGISKSNVEYREKNILEKLKNFWDKT